MVRFGTNCFGYFVANAAHAPSGHYFGPKTTLTQGHQGTLKHFLSDGFPATVLISESFRNNHPIETGFQSEWLRYNPKGPRGPIPPRAPKAPFGTLGHPGVPLGPLGPTPRDRNLVEATERRLESLVAERLYRREDTGSAACA